MLEKLKKRMGNPIFIGAAAAFTYKVLQANGITIDAGTWQQGVDLLAYLAIGAGIYSSFDAKE
ncbi:MAG: hypothetical protein C4562_01085 [Actinobacteria bacterium]|nr:MAG: hypothetical protein C4562_01085 [Actinomycetota bacterium]